MHWEIFRYPFGAPVFSVPFEWMAKFAIYCLGTAYDYEEKGKGWL